MIARVSREGEVRALSDFKVRCFLDYGAKADASTDSDFKEPVEAVEWAELWLRTNGEPNQSYCEIVFNGAEEIHAVLYYILDDDGFEKHPAFGLQNTKLARWPVNYADDEDGRAVMLPEDWQHPEHKMEDEDNEIEDEDESEDEDDDEPEEDDSKPEPLEAVRDNDFGNSEDEEEDEPVRLTWFGKFKGPKGWRKRAETDPESARQVMSVVFGVLDTEAAKAGEQESDRRIVVEFIEPAMILSLTLPEGVTPDDFIPVGKSGQKWKLAIPDPAYND